MVKENMYGRSILLNHWIVLVGKENVGLLRILVLECAGLLQYSMRLSIL